MDAIGGSSAGVIVDHVPQVGSLFRGLSEGAMASAIRPFFKGLSQEWGGIPVSLLNDGEVTALAGANWLGTNGVLGVAMGTSLASGYVDPEGQVGMYLNELAFCPVDFDEGGPADEWSGDIGCGVQYFSQQAVFRLAKVAGIQIPEGLDGAQSLKHVQNLAEKGDEGAKGDFPADRNLPRRDAAVLESVLRFRALVAAGTSGVRGFGRFDHRKRQGDYKGQRIGSSLPGADPCPR